MEFAQDVARKLAESYREHGDTLPPALEATLDGSSAGFVSDRGAKGSHEIWWNPATGLSELLVHEASAFVREPLARIKLPVRVPFAFHGSWAEAEVLDAAVAAQSA